MAAPSRTTSGTKRKFTDPETAPEATTAASPEPAEKRRRLEDDSHGPAAADAATGIRWVTRKDGQRERVDADGVPVDRPVRVYVDGIFDMFHFGHARALMQAKKVFPNALLLVGVCNDEITHRLKGKTVMSDKERYESVRNCKWVDEVIEAAPWYIDQEFLDKHDIDFVVHGEDAVLDSSGNDVYKFVKDQGKFRTIKRTEGISTTDLIIRIIRDYDKYVRRNLKRGVPGKEMNVGFIKERRLRIGDGLTKMKDKVKDALKVDAIIEKVEDWTEDIKESVQTKIDSAMIDFKKWKERSDHLVHGFVRSWTRKTPPNSPQSPRSPISAPSSPR